MDRTETENIVLTSDIYFGRKEITDWPFIVPVIHKTVVSGKYPPARDRKH